MARPSLHGSIYGVSGEGMTHPGGSYMADSLTNNSVPVAVSYTHLTLPTNREV